MVQRMIAVILIESCLAAHSMAQEPNPSAST